MRRLLARDADFQHQSFLELRPIAVYLQILGILAWLASLLFSHRYRQIDNLNAVLVCLIMLIGVLLSHHASHHRTLLLGMLLYLGGLALGFRLNMLIVTDPSPWAISIAVCISLTMAPVFHHTPAFLLASTGIWAVLLQGTQGDPRLWAQDSWVILLIVTSTTSGLMLNILFRRLRLRDFTVRCELEALAFQDVLTGIDNRRSLLEKMQAWYPAQLGYFLMVDIDDFKSVNDDFGHDAGDKVLQDIAALLSRHPEVSLCGRLGGEEFGLFTRLSDHGQVQRLACQLIQQVNQCRIQHRQLSISIGIVSMDGRIGLSAALREADRALYQAKRNGKNRHVFATSSDDAVTPLTLQPKADVAMKKPPEGGLSVTHSKTQAS
ncbi:diguanylate cyclase [Aquitalea sp. LB_tupeE]|uniref:GGDEF domain-containing protein n=1 Tax=Aquitalea sp. LB_tupeE TaxID=2748078 RepID=UPI0015BC64F4|nr:GGDEF domain-containing protein [Aquitalea sp. LB_tupeE]NWK77864.1 GGDEF domain-containing protein [Aquitalea sp. LB_tupeE]